eukprot:m.41156 g.41156  ORF g.41156 m.41156 type:complete len:108 (-) comp10522_c0_seq1:1640-1963(-)
MGGLLVAAVVCVALALRMLTALGPHSGSNKPPMYGDFEAQRHWMEVRQACLSRFGLTIHFHSPPFYLFTNPLTHETRSLSRSALPVAIPLCLWVIDHNWNPDLRMVP